MNIPLIRNAAAGNALPASFASPGISDAIDLTRLASRLTQIIPARLTKARRPTLYDAGKQLLDLALSAVLLAILALPFAGIALLVKATSSGPALFRQDRIGQGGRLFAIYKFRSMYQEAPRHGYSPMTGTDPRITPVGRFLRRTSLVELPQLINVFMGQMSLVGPRPEMPFIVEQYSAEQRQRLCVKPGITGLWQISPHRGSPIHEHLEYDFYYVAHRSLALDAVILLRTVRVAARGI